MPSIDPPWPKVLSLAVHEFRNPLSVVVGYMRMVLTDRAGPLNDQQRKLLREAEKSCARLSELLGELSDLSHLEGGKARIKKQKTDLQAAVRAAVAQLPPMPDPAQKVAVHLELGSEPAPIDGDPVRLTQAFGSIIVALRRELTTDHGLTVRQKSGSSTYELLIGDPDTIAALETESDVQRQVFDEWRGGVGFSLGVARRVLDAHDGHIFAPPGDAKAGARILFR